MTFEEKQKIQDELKRLARLLNYEEYDLGLFRLKETLRPLREQFTS